MAVTLAVPGVFFVVFFIVNSVLALLPPLCFRCLCDTLLQVLWSRQSSGAVPFGTLIALISLWCLVSAPLVFIGSFIGFKREAQDYPCRTNTIPRQVCFTLTARTIARDPALPPPADPPPVPSSLYPRLLHRRRYDSPSFYYRIPLMPRRRPPLWCRVRRAVLHREQHLAAQVLLHVRFSSPRLFDLLHHVR